MPVLYPARAAFVDPPGRDSYWQLFFANGMLRRCAEPSKRAYGDADFDFYLAIARAARNAALHGIYASFVDVAKSALRAMIEAHYIQNERDTLHGALCDAIDAGDVAKVRRLVRSHLQGSRENMEAYRKC